MKGQGTVNDPYVLETISDVQSIPSGSTSQYILGNDIDFAGNPFTTLASRTFSGVLDGNYHRLKNVGGSKPLFNTVSGGTVKNLALEDLALTPILNIFGPLCAVLSNGGTILKCWTTGTVYANGNGILSYGGIVGKVNGADSTTGKTTISKSWSSVTIKNLTANSLQAGGICSYVQRTYCTNGQYMINVSLNQLLFGGKLLDSSGNFVVGGPIFFVKDQVQTYNWGDNLPGFVTSDLFCFSENAWSSTYWRVDDTILGTGTVHNTDSTARSPLNTAQSRVQNYYTNFDFVNDWLLNNNINFWKPVLRRFGLQASWSTTLRSTIETNAMQAIRDYIQSSWSYVELASYSGTVWKRLALTDPRVQWTHTPGAQTLQLTITIKGTDADVTIPLAIGKISMYNVAVGGSALVSEQFTEQNITVIENVLTLTYQLQIPKVG